MDPLSCPASFWGNFLDVQHFLPSKHDFGTAHVSYAVVSITYDQIQSVVGLVNFTAMEEFPQSPSKRARLDTQEGNAMQVDDPDDFYDDDDNVRPSIQVGPSTALHVPRADSTHGTLPSSNTATAASALPENSGTAPEVKPDSIDSIVTLVKQKSVSPASNEQSDNVQVDTLAHVALPPSEVVPQPQQASITKPPLDAEFLAAAQQNKTNENAEWRFDSSDAESSSDDSSDTSSDDSSEDDSDDEDEGILLDPAEAARMLMKEEGGEDGDKVPKGPIKTQNELDATFTKPDINITPEMTVVELGSIDNIVGNLALVKAKTSGEFRVLESGSLLCLADRTVVGEVFEPLGRVHAPMYSVGFPQQADIDALGITKGTTIYYVEQHSTYVFTEAIQKLKGSDASNMHDEEVFGEEIEFSDDEAEAEYKRNLKQARQAKRASAQGMQPGSAPVTGATGYQSRPNNYLPPVPEASYPSAISYDDDDGEDMYKPLTRPDNLSQMMGASPPPLERRSNDNARGAFNGRGRGDRDRGRGRGRGRGDRGPRGGGPHRGRGDRSQGYNKDQRNGSYSTPHSYDLNPNANQQQYQDPAYQQPPYSPPVPQPWSPNTSQQPHFVSQNFPPPPPPPAAFAQQQTPAMQQQSFDPQAWVQYFQQHAAQAMQQPQQQQQQQPYAQQQQYAPQGPGGGNYSGAQVSGQGTQPDLSSLMRNLSQGGNRQA